jgi:8-oxo-dGTP pyrophosphatase MutT (NUDIX family)
MKLLKTIQLDNLSSEEIAGFTVRQAARTVLFDNAGNVGLLYVAKHNYHKLPGGGVEEGESIAETLKRECLEEIGCDLEVQAELGETIEYRTEWSLEQHSFCYLSKVVGDKNEPNFTPKELANGFVVKWVALPEAIRLLENDNTTDYEGKFIKIRDGVFLQAALNHIKNN